MPLNMNFDTPLKLDDHHAVVVTGTSETVDGATLMSRRIVLRQGNALAEGDAPGAPDWSTQPLSATPPFGPFGPGQAICLGTELHVADNTDSQGDVAAQVTVTWSQAIELA